MFKKVLFIILSIFIFLNFTQIDVNAACNYTSGMGLDSFLDGCKPENVVGSTGEGGYEITGSGGIKDKVNVWITNISLILGILAVGALVYSGLLLQFAAGEDEKVKKAKDIFKWSIIGFLGLISASGIIALVINIIYSLS